MRAIICVLDSLVIGSTDDAERFGDAGANTFGHIASACAKGDADRAGLRRGPLAVPNFARLGLVHAAEAAGGCALPIARPSAPEGVYGFAAEQSVGKDTPSGHWELMGLPVPYDWAHFPAGPPSFPADLVDELIQTAQVPGFLGNRHASGTAIVEKLGEEHLRTGMPILYTSADSVLQIAAHETAFGLDRLYRVCQAARVIADRYNIGRVIARPFVGANSATFKRTGNRKDYGMPPHGPTLLDRVAAAGGEVVGIGKIHDIFAGAGITRTIKGDTNDKLFDATLSAARETEGRAIVFTNFVDFDTLFGHRRDVAGYAAALEAFDGRIPEIEALMAPEDVLVFTADHGCDPTWPGSDHTREYVPLVLAGQRLRAGAIGRRASFADLAESLAAPLGVAPLRTGQSFLQAMRGTG